MNIEAKILHTDISVEQPYAEIVLPLANVISYAMHQLESGEVTRRDLNPKQFKRDIAIFSPDEKHCYLITDWNVQQVGNLFQRHFVSADLENDKKWLKGLSIKRYDLKPDKTLDLPTAFFMDLPRKSEFINNSSLGKNFWSFEEYDVLTINSIAEDIHMGKATSVKELSFT